MNTTTRLIMTFKTELDKKVSLSVDNPREDITEEEISDVMTLILTKDIFQPNGSSLVSMVEAKVVTTDTTEYDLVV